MNNRSFTPAKSVAFRIFVETKDGRRFSGRATMEGVLPRVETYNEEEYIVYRGDVALAKMEGVV